MLNSLPITARLFATVFLSTLVLGHFSGNVARASEASPLFVEEDFSYDPAPLYDEARTPTKTFEGGTGWKGEWQLQNAGPENGFPGFNISNISPLTYNNLVSSPGNLAGGEQYLTAGRVMLTDNTTAADSASYIEDGSYGISGQELWVSFLLRVDILAAQTRVALSKSGMGMPDSVSQVVVGKIGDSDQWGLMVGTELTKHAEVDIYADVPTLIVLRYVFNADRGAVVSLFVNPDLTKTLPEPNVQIDTGTTAVSFSSMSFSPGPGENSAALDAFRVGPSFEAVTPRTSTNLPVTPTKP